MICEFIKWLRVISSQIQNTFFLNANTCRIKQDITPPHPDPFIASRLTVLLGLTRNTTAAATILIYFATLLFAVLIGFLVWAISGKLLFSGDEPSGEQPPDNN